MRIRILTALATAMLVSLAVASAPVFAKTAKDCRTEWQADKVAMKAAGKTEKAYVAECAPKTAAKPAAAAAPVKKEGSGKDY